MKKQINQDAWVVPFRTTICLIGSSKINKSLIIDYLFGKNLSLSLDPYYQQSFSPLYISLTNTSKENYPLRVIEVDLEQNGNFFKNFPQHEHFKAYELIFLYVVNVSDFEEIEGLERLLMQLKMKEIKKKKKKDQTDQIEIGLLQNDSLYRNYKHRKDFMVIGIVDNENVQTDTIATNFEKKFDGLEFYLLDLSKPSDAIELTSRCLNEVSTMQEEKKKLIYKQNSSKSIYLSNIPETEMIKSSAKEMAVSQIKPDEALIHQRKFKKQWLYFGQPPHELWKESQKAISSQQSLFFKQFEKILENNVVWRERKKHFYNSIMKSSFQFYSSLTKEFLESFCNLLVSQYLSFNGTLNIKNSQIKMMSGQPESEEFEKIKLSIEVERKRKYEIFLKNEKIKQKIQIHNQSNIFSIHEFDDEGRKEFVSLIVKTYLEFDTVNFKVFLALKDERLKLFLGNPQEKEFSLIKKDLEAEINKRTLLLEKSKNLNEILDKKQRILRLYKNCLNTNFEFDDSFEPKQLEYFVKDLASHKVSKSKKKIKKGDIRLMLGQCSETELEATIEKIKIKKKMLFLIKINNFIYI